jgi:hypothetical protein
MDIEENQQMDMDNNNNGEHETETDGAEQRRLTDTRLVTRQCQALGMGLGGRATVMPTLILDSEDGKIVIKPTGDG